MKSLSKFLWADWTRSRLIEFGQHEEDGCGFTKWSGEHYGYLDQGVTHRRTIYAIDDDWLVIDDALFSHPRSQEGSLVTLAPGRPGLARRF